MQMDLCLGLELVMGNYLRIFLSNMRKHFVMVEIIFSLDPVSQADTVHRLNNVATY